LAGGPLEVHGDGTQTRCFCHVLDTITGLKGLMEDGTTSGEIYNIGSTDRIRILDLAEKVIALTSSSSSVEFVPYERVYGLGIEDMLHRIPSIEKIDGQIGWQPTRSLDA